MQEPVLTAASHCLKMDWGELEWPQNFSILPFVSLQFSLLPGIYFRKKTIYHWWKEMKKLISSPSHHLLGHSITYSIAMGSQQGREASASCSRPSPTSL